MTQDEIIEMACQTFGGIIKKEERKKFIAFAKLVEEKEREKCAEIAKWHQNMVAEIRARGQK
jgi:hypothetical protein